MRTRAITFILLALHSLWAAGQIRVQGYRQQDINPALLANRWQAHWISVPNEPANTYGVYHMRKTFEIAEIPEQFIVHATADNRYKLYLNGRLVSSGPARGDIYNWNFETVDLAPYLQKGKNALAAIVWNYAELKPVAQMSFGQTGFLLQGNSEREALVNTNSSWLCLKNNAYQPWQKAVAGYYVAGPGEQLTAALYPWGWEQTDYDDSQWQPAQQGIEGAAKGARDYPGRLLVPRPIPPLDMVPERFEQVRIAEGMQLPACFPNEKANLTIPPHSQVHLLLDNGRLTTGYLSLLFSKGKDAVIEIDYAEALYNDAQQHAKGDRDAIEGKQFLGYGDRVIADGGDARQFTTLWWRTWRYVDLHISTADAPLTIEDVYGTFTAYPFKNETAFSAPGHEELNKMLEIGWRTARLCANETYMDCPYYEQLQYFGDTRIQAMISLYNTRDSFMVKNALEQGRQSLVPDGLTMSRYPSSLHQFIPPFSLWWICMGHDYWMYRGEEEYLRSLLPAYRSVLAWFEQWLKPDKSLAYIPHWFFADWAAGFSAGEPVRDKEGNSAFQDLTYLIALADAAEMEQAFGMPAMAAHYKQIIADMRAGFKDKYWDDARGLFADTQSRNSFSQHVNALAILAEAVTGKQATAVMQRTLADSTLIQATIYFRYYVHQALKKAGLGDLYLDNLQIWRDQMALGLTTWAESPEPSRSDCHAWGASPNIELFRILLGIDSQSPGFQKIRIAPSLCTLKEVSGTMPHPHGFIRTAYQVDKRGKLTAHIELPQGTSGVFAWKGKEYPLKAGKQTIVAR